MPTAYFDTSALVKRYVTEVGSVWVRHAHTRPQQQLIYTALLAQPEMLSAFQRKVREQFLTATEAQLLARRVQRNFARRYRVVAITPMLVTQACVFIQAHPLRAYDAIHLACADTVKRILQQQGLPAPLFVAADDTLLAAATAEGFAVDNPLWHS